VVLTVGDLDEQFNPCREVDNAMLRVTKYFAKSLEVIRNDTREYSVCKSLLKIPYRNLLIFQQF